MNKSTIPAPVFEAQVLIPLYSIILLLSVIGNGLVISTLIQNKRMRTSTNVHLLNLAVSDLLLSVFCMPFTLAGNLLQNFIFGEVMCRLIPYVQAVSVTVSAWTLVAISIERYYAICHPLRSRRWQTLTHAHKIITSIWIGSLVCMSPTAILSVLQPLGNSGRLKCREDWPIDVAEKAYVIFLDIILLVVPLVIMATNYSLITATLWKGIKTDEKISNGDGTKTYSADKDVPQYYNGHTPTTNHCSSENILPFGNMRETISLQAMPTHCDGHSEQEKMMMVPDVRAGSSSALEVSVRSSNSGQYLQVRSSNVKLSLANKKRVIKMLFVVVLEYFVCWTPTYIINTLALYQPKLVYHELGYMALSVFQLLGFISSCCNPITYCFMNSRFKHAFLSAFGCQRRSWQPSGLSNVSSKTSFPMKLESEI